jgi:hypothetical protein
VKNILAAISGIIIMNEIPKTTKTEWLSNHASE